MKRKYLLVSLCFTLVNLLVLATLFGSEVKAYSAQPESLQCDCSVWYIGAGEECVPDIGSVLCFYPEGPNGYPEWIWEYYMECVEGATEDYCDCDWEFNYCEESN